MALYTYVSMALRILFGISRTNFGLCTVDDMARRLDELESSLTIANDTAATTTPSK